MADEKVEIKLDADIAGFITRMKRAERAMKSFKKEEGKLLAKGGMNSYFDQMDRKVSSVKRTFDSFDKGVKMMGTGLTKFLGLAIKGTLLQMAAMGAAMLAIHASFVVGNGLMKAYAGTMKFLAGGAAGVAIALSTVAAAMREQQAAMFAFSGRGASQFGSGTNQARVAMRGLATDSDLAVLGMANINKAYGAMAKSMSSTQILGSKNLMKALFDFGAAGQDPAQAAEKIGVVIEALNDTKKSFSDVQTAAKELGPQMEKAMKDLGVKTKKEFQEALLSGDLAKEGGVLGQFAAVNSTLISRIKAFFNLLKEEFADFGQKFLEPAKVAMEKIMRIIKRDLMRVGAELESFGTGGFFEGLVSAVDKVSSFFVKLIREYLPGAQGIFGRISDFFDRLGRGWQSMTDKLRPFIEGARVIESIFSPIWRTIKEEGTKSFESFNEQLIANSGSVAEFGERIADLLKSAFEIGRVFREMWFESLPFINDVLSGVTQIVDMLKSMVSGFGSMFGSTGGLMAFSIMARQMKSTQGGLLGMAKGTMTLTPQTVIINAPGAMPMTLTPGGTPNIYGGAGVAPPGAGVRPPGSPSGVSSGAIGVQNPHIAAAMYRTGLQTTHLPPPHPGQQVVQTGPAGKRSIHFGMQTGRQMFQTPDGKFYSTMTGRELKGGTFGSTLREMRGTRGGVALLGNGSTVGGIANSMGAKMGVGMGLAAASQFAPAEMRGAMALGGMVGSFNPLAGLAIAGLGGAAQSRNQLAGALAGATGGAAAGAMVAGPVGAAIGGALGALGGALRAGSNKVAYEAKEAKKTIRVAMDGIMIQVAQGIGNAFNQNIAAVQAGLSTKNSRSSISGLTASYRRSTVGAIGILRDPLARAEASRARMQELRDTRSGIDAVGLNKEFKNFEKIEKELKAVFKQIQRNPSRYGGLTMTSDMLGKIEKDPVSAAQEFMATNKKQLKANEFFEKTNEMRMKRLQTMTGKSNAEIESLAHSLGVNLYDATVKFEDMVQKLGLTMVRNADQMRQANVDVYVSAGEVFQKIIKQNKATQIIDEQAEALRVALAGGGVKGGEIIEFLGNIQSSVLDKNQGNALKSYQEIFGQVGTAANPGLIFGKGGVLEGRQKEFFEDPAVQSALGQYYKTNETGFRTEAVTQIQGLLGSEGKFIDANILTAAIQRMPLDKQIELASGLQNTTMSQTDTTKSIGFGGIGGTSGGIDQDLSSQILSVLGLGGLTENLRDTDEGAKQLDQVANNMDKWSTQTQLAMLSLVSRTGDLFQGVNATPEWMKPEALKNALNAAGFKNDTSSPRGNRVGDTTSSRLSQTMARHSAVDGMLTGTRSITSSYRTYGLGSPSSDHVKGRAIDLVGANLGQYKVLTEKSGGFAEFHGRGASRHLHVVPGPGAIGIGDTASPMSTNPPIVVSSGASGSNNYYTFNINGSNMSPEQVANQVMAKIRDQQRAERER